MKHSAFNRLVPLTVAAALFMENMDSSVIATALPAIARDLGEDPVTMKLAFTAYLISLAVFIPLSGWAADRYGARHVFRLAIATFTVASIGCALAWSLESLVAARAVQGIGGSMMIPVGRAILLRSVPRERIVDAMIYLTLPALVGPLVGPPLGGFITVAFDWRWIFWINVPFGILAVVLASLYMPDVRAEEREPFDLTGFLLSGLGLAALVGGLTVFSSDAAPRGVAPGLMLAGVLMLALYVRHARRRTQPILRLTLMEIITLRSSLLGGVFFRLGAGALAFLMPLLLQLGFGFDAFHSGSLTFAAAVGAMSMKFAARPVLRALGFQRVLVWNALICAVFLVAFGWFTAATPALIIFAVLLAGGFFRSLQFTSLGALAYADVEPRDMSQASTLFSTVQQFAIAAGVAIAALVLSIMREGHGGGALTPGDFGAAFAVLAAITALSALAHWRLPANAGAVVAGRSPVATAERLA